MATTFGDTLYGNIVADATLPDGVVEIDKLLTYAEEIEYALDMIYGEVEKQQLTPTLNPVNDAYKRREDTVRTDEEERFMAGL